MKENLIQARIEEERGGGFYHITIHPYYWRKDCGRWENRPAYEDNLPDLGEVYLNSQMDCHGTSTRPYATEIRISTGNIDAEKIHSLSTALKTVERKLDRYTKEDGYPQSFGQMALRFAKAIGAAGFLRRNVRGEWCQVDLLSGMSCIDNLVVQWYAGETVTRLYKE